MSVLSTRIPVKCVLDQFVLFSMNPNPFSISLSLSAAFWVIVFYPSPVHRGSQLFICPFARSCWRSFLAMAAVLCGPLSNAAVALSPQLTLFSWLHFFLWCVGHFERTPFVTQFFCYLQCLGLCSHCLPLTCFLV